jgi:chromosome segregation protein
VYLSALTLKGFKSFASSTTLRFERGMTCVVGPNGSGKSNVVDAVAWVLGEQGARSLRGGSMADVIFAGTPGRPPLGRAEVSVTFDNSDGSIPEGAGEVTVTRTMFRTGGSEYAVNGRSCRLLDIQEMLGDAGLGREMHVLVGQGRVDAVLAATPQDRRLFLEEAAGVAKHRRRKEKAMRKLAAMDGNLVRLADLTSEVARQLKPLGRQARTARRARVLASEARDARLRLLADDAAAAVAALAALDPVDGEDTATRLAAVDRGLTAAEAARAAAEQALARTAPEVAAWRSAAARAVTVHDRLRTVVRLAEDRLRLLDSAPAVAGGADPAAADVEARAAADEAAALEAGLAAAHDAVREAAGRRARLEGEHAAAERAAAQHARTRGKARDDVARLRSDLASARARLDAAEAEAHRLATAVAEATARHDEAMRTSAAEPGGESADASADGSSGEGPTDAEREAADAAVAAAREAHRVAVATARDLETAERSAGQQAAAARARQEALESVQAPQDGAAVVLRGHPAARRVTDELDVVPGLEAAVAAALGEAAGGLAVDEPAAAAAAVAAVTEAGAGRVWLVLPATTAPDGSAAGELSGAVRARGAVADWARARLSGVRLADDLAAAMAAVAAPGGPATAVTRGGEVATADLVAGGTGDAAAALRRRTELAAARDAAAAADERAAAARAAAATARADVEAVAAALRGAEDERERTSRRAAAAAAARAGVRARIEGAAAEARRTAAAAEAAGRRCEELAAEVARREAAVEAGEERVSELDETPEDGPGSADVTALARDARSAREDETAARVAARGAEERLAAARRRASAAAEAAAAAHRAVRAAEAEIAARTAARRVAAGVHAAAADAVQEALRVRTLAAGALAGHEDEHDRAAAALGSAAREVERLVAERTRLADALHAEELARTERRMRLDGLAEHAMTDFGLTVADLVAQFGPDRPVPVVREPAAGGVAGAGDDPADEAAGEAGEGPGEGAGAGPEPLTEPYDRATQTRRLREAERGLAALGTINPLAMEEYAALEERHRFLLQQQQDLTDSKRDLLSIIRDVDERVEQVVAEAFADTARHFAEVVPRLFPGGTGRLVLTDPDDLLETGIEVEARPAGKTVKRLSLLSGGERTLVALAFLVALFRARPSPFYVLDEIEAALDDTNLQRLLLLLEELRATSQLVVVTHQRRTMEAADALYGVAMRDGVTTVVGQRLREPQPAA